MQLFTSILFFVIAALVFTGIASLFFKTRGPWGTLWSFFLIVFLFIWAASIWVQPVGPVYYDISWGSVLIVGLLISLFLIAVAPRNHSAKKDPIQTNPEQNLPTPVVVMDFVFWIMTFILLTSIVASFFIT